MVDLYEFNRQRPLSSNSKSRPQMLSPRAIAQNQTVAAAASGANVGTNAAPVRRFWPSYIDQHVAQLDFDASVMMMTSAGDECQNDDDEEDDDEEDEDGGDEDDVVQQGGGRPQQRLQIGGGMARGGGGAEETARDGNIFDSNSSSMMMAMMALDAAGVAAATAAAADSAQLISTDSLDMEQLRVRCECTKHNANYKLTFDEDSGQWTTSGIGGSFTTTATASPPVAQQQKQQHQRRLKQHQQLKQLLAMNTTATAMNNNNNSHEEEGEEEDRDGHGDEHQQQQQQLYTAIMDNNGALGLQLLEQLNNADDDDQDNDTSAYSGGVFNATAEKRSGVRRRPATSVGHGTTTTATDGWRKNSFMDALLNNNPNHNANTSSSASSTFHGNNFRGDAATKKGDGGGMGMMTTWGRLHQQSDDMGGGQQPPFNSEKVHSLPELNSNKQPQQRGGGGIGTDLSSVDGATTNTIATFAKGASTPAMATYQQQQPQQHRHVQPVHGSVSSSSSSAGLRRPTSSSLLDNFIATQRQQQQQQRNGGPQMVDYAYSETYLGNGRYIDMNENEIGYVPSCTASIQRSGGDLHHHQQLALFDLDLRRRQLLLGVGGSKDSDDDGGPFVGAVPVTAENDPQPQQQRQLMRTMIMKMNTNSNNMTETAPLGHKLGNDNQLQHNANANQQRQQQRRQSHHQMGATKTKAAATLAMPTTATMPQQQRRTFADLSASRTVPDLKFIALAHNVPTICPPSSVSLDNLLCRVRNSATAADGNGGIGGANAAAIDELIDCCASSMRILSEPDGGGASDGPDSGLGSSHSDGPSHIEDWASLSVLLPRNVLEACSFFKTNSFLLTGSSNNIEGRRPAVPPPRSFTSATLWRLKEKGNCCLRHWGGANTDPSTPTTPTVNDAALCGCSSSSCCCCCTSFGTTAGLPGAAAHGEQCTKSAVFARQQISSRSRAVLSQKLRLHARELALIGLPVYDQKRAIIERVVEGVTELIRGASSVVLMKALERLLGDELLPGVRMWHVICTVTGPGPVTRNVYQLIQQLEASEKPDHSRVGHFFRGLLSLHSLDGWLSYVVLKEHVLRPFYAPSAFLIGAQTAYRSLYCRLIECVELLSVLNQCGEAGKRWERRQRQQQRVATTADDRVTARVGVAVANDAHHLDQRQVQQQHMATRTMMAWCGGSAARLPKDSRVPKSSSMPTKLVAAASSSTKLSTDCIEEEEQEVEVVHCQQDKQQHHNSIKLEDVKLVEVQQREQEEDKTAENERPNSMADNDNVVQSRDTDAVGGAADTVVHAGLRPSSSRIPILRTRSRSSIMHSDGGSPIAAQQRHSPTTLSRRSSSARPTPSLSPVYICPVREAITAEHADQQSASLPHGSAAGGGTLLYPLRKGERVRVLAIRGEYTRCSRLPAAEHRQQQLRQQRLALQNGLVPTRTLQFGANNGTTALNDERMTEL